MDDRKKRTPMVEYNKLPYRDEPLEVYIDRRYNKEFAKTVIDSE